jgi:preprotein translocase subunit YajC
MDLGDNYVLLEITEGVNIKVQRQAVGALVPKGTFKSTL